MNTTQPLDEVRPSTTPGTLHAEPFRIPLLRLRGHDRTVILPDECQVKDCLVCQWRREGLLDHPTPSIVREPISGYSCHSAYCPGCNTVRCTCPPEGYEEALSDAAYALGYDHGLADGPENRPTRCWLDRACLDADAYLEGYDAACASVTWPGDELDDHTLS